ncbi:Hypothetical predicted protein, partial [Olea europaea subsp. europaea]
MDKDNKHHGSRTIRLPRWWFSRKHKEADPFQFNVKSDGGEENDDYMDGVADGLSEKDPCISTNELRVFVGTWNVAGRSPVGCLAVDLDEWLNLKDVADIYVLGCPWLTPLLNPIATNEGITDCERRTSISGLTTTPVHGQQSKYKLMASKKMVGVFISVWMRRELLEKYNIAGVQVCSVACGIMGYL